MKLRHRFFLAALVLLAAVYCGERSQAWWQSVAQQSIAAGGGTSYVTGDRTASITITESVPGLIGGGTLSNLVDGAFGDNTSDSTFFAGVTVSGRWLKFDFATGKIVDEAKWYQDQADSHGTWQWEGSNDDTNWTSVGSSFTLGGATTQTQTSLNGNSTSYRYYRLLGVSGNTSSNPWIREIEFKQNFLLKRDLDAAANDNTPMGLNHVA